MFQKGGVLRGWNCGFIKVRFLLVIEKKIVRHWDHRNKGSDRWYIDSSVKSLKGKDEILSHMEIKSCFAAGAVLTAVKWTISPPTFKNLRCEVITTKVGVEFIGVRIWDNTLGDFWSDLMLGPGLKLGKFIFLAFKIKAIVFKIFLWEGAEEKNEIIKIPHEKLIIWNYKLDNCYCIVVHWLNLLISFVLKMMPVMLCSF